MPGSYFALLLQLSIVAIVNSDDQCYPCDKKDYPCGDIPVISDKAVREAFLRGKLDEMSINAQCGNY